MDYTKLIESLLDTLSSTDKSIGIKYLRKRDFESLKELVDSAIIRSKRRGQEDPSNNLLDITPMLKLKAVVDSYVKLLQDLGVIDNDDDYDEPSLDDDIYDGTFSDTFEDY